MIDSIEGLSDQDKKIANLIVRKGKGVIIVLNKWDLQSKMPNAFEAVSDRVKFLFPILGFAPIVPLSALKSEGVEELLDTVIKIRHQLQKRVETSTLNSHLTDWVEENEAPRSKKGRYKIKYMTQVSAEPIKFLLFVNNKKGFPESYQRYILRMIRQDFGMPSVPITMELRDSKKLENGFLYDWGNLQAAGVKPHVLRYWEQEFELVNPRKDRAEKGSTLGTMSISSSELNTCFMTKNYY